MIFGIIAIGVVLIILVLRYPYLGVVFTIASLPVTDILRQVPYATSLITLIGAVTIASFLISRKVLGQRRPFQLINVHILGLLLIGWIFISNPQAALLGRDRNWTFTFLQLWILLWLTGELLDTPHKHNVLVWVYSLVTIASAVVAIQQGSLEQQIDIDLRVSGLAGGANTAARYFVVAMIFLNYLRVNTSNQFMRVLAVGGLIITFWGVFFTVSRTGMLLLFAAFGLIILMQPRLRYRFQVTIVFIIALVTIWYQSDNILQIMQTIMPSITRGTDTMGLRYALWKAGWRMWLDHPIQGVGVGMYSSQLRYYAQDLLIHPRFWSAVSHNMYVQMLAETGIVGLFLFILMLGKTIQNFWRTSIFDDTRLGSIRNIWFIVFVIMLLGGMTKTDQVDKMIWMTMGVSVYFYHLAEAKSQVAAEGKAMEGVAIS